MPLNRRVKNKKPARDQAVFNKFRRPIMEILKKLVVQEAQTTFSYFPAETERATPDPSVNWYTFPGWILLDFDKFSD